MEEKDKNKTKGISATRYATYIYAAMAICVVTVIAVSIFAMSYDYGDISTPMVSLPNNSVGEVIQNPSESSRPGKPVDNPQSDIDDTFEEPSDVDAATTTYQYPVTGEVIKKFTVTSLIASKTMKDYRTHSGIDIAAKIGTAVVAYTDGVITAISNDPLMGKTVEIAHSYGIKSVYMNLSETLANNIKVGSKVKTGDVIGAVGETACAEICDDPHLHFELMLDGVNIDPEKELNAITVNE